MLKKFVSSLCLICLLVGCSSGAGSSNLNVKSTASDLVSTLGLKDSTVEVEENVVNGLFFFDEGVIEESSVYIANDSTADLVGVFKTTNVDSCKNAINTYLATTKETMQAYYPQEVFKIDNAIIKNSGNTVIVVVCSNMEEAKTAIAKYIKEA